MPVSPRTRLWFPASRSWAVFLLLLVPCPAIRAQPKQPADVPSSAEVAALLQREPIRLATWPAWRERLLAWIDDRGRNTDAAYLAARDFCKSMAGPEGQLPQALADDALAWYFLGSADLNDAPGKGTVESSASRAERALRHSLALNPAFARAHSRLALALLEQDHEGEARKEVDESRRLDPSLPSLKALHAAAAVRLERFGPAETFFKQALDEEPAKSEYAEGAAYSILFNRDRAGKRAPDVKRLLDRFPEDGVLICLHGAALAVDGDARAGVKEFHRARSLGVDPATVLSPKAVEEIEEAGAPGLLERFGWVMLCFAGFYAVVMLLMAGAGVVLASQTRGNRALHLLSAPPGELLTAGQIARTRLESLLARLYSLALFVGLILFYLSIPFVVAGLLAATGLLLYAVFMLPRVPVKLIVIIAVIGLGGAWAVFKSLFARPGSGSFGLVKTAADCPRLYELLNEVAVRIDTQPVDEVYLAPGSGIGVHQEGRGPFGVFGVKRRVLTLGLSTLHFLTVDELKAILAHEYAHYSHGDTFYSRFIYQVTLSIEQALQGMAGSGGKLNYVNPFYWFLYLYYKCYTLLAAGYSRSREFLADRMASILYGSDVFGNALTKVCTDGSLFEMTVYHNIAGLLDQGKSFVNMYDAFRNFREQQLTDTERADLYKKMLEGRASMFASHPTFGERIAAVAVLPKARQSDTRFARELFPDPEATEKELTEFLTGYMAHLRQLQVAAGQ